MEDNRSKISLRFGRCLELLNSLEGCVISGTRSEWLADWQEYLVIAFYLNDVFFQLEIPSGRMVLYDKDFKKLVSLKDELSLKGYLIKQ